MDCKFIHMQRKSDLITPVNGMFVSILTEDIYVSQSTKDVTCCVHAWSDHYERDPSDLTKMSCGDHDILTAISHEYFTATSF